MEETRTLRTRWTFTALGIAMAMGAAVSANAQSRAENSLVGIKLFDSGIRVVSIYGSPDEIQAVGIGGSTSVGGGMGSRGGPAGFPGGMPGMPSAGGRGGGMSGAPAAGMSADINSPFAFGDTVLRQMGMPGMPGGRGGAPGMPGGYPGAQSGGGYPGGGYPGAPGGTGAPGMPGGRGMSGAPGMGAPGMGAPGMPGMGGSRMGGGAASAGPGERVTYTRWVYNRANSKYGFIIDKFGRVVQIEAIGLNNAKVRTRRGVGFGSTFAQIIKKYGSPEGYDIAGDAFTLRYLNRARVAFRMSRLGEKKPHQVTGIVIAAGK